MMHILIIDDEKPVRQAIVALGHWDALGGAELFEAVEGESGLTAMRQYRPEIVLVDMKMPRMDGAKFLEIAGREFPGVKYIVISGYDDFEYARRALRAKVMDYLLKPVIESELNEVLGRAVREIQAEKNRLAMQRLSMPLAKENLIKMLINEEVKEPLTAESLRLLDCWGTGTVYAIALLRIVNLDEACRAKNNGDYHSIMSFAVRLADQLGADWNRGFSFRDYQVRNEILLFIAVDTSPGCDCRLRAAAELNGIVRQMQMTQGIFVIAGLGPFVERLELLSRSYRSAANILYHANILDCKESVFTETETEGNRLRPSLLDKKEMLIYAMESGNLEQVRRIIMEYFQNIRSTGFLSLEYLRRTAREFLVLLENISGQFQISGDDHACNGALDEAAIMSYTQLENFSDAVYRAVEQIFYQIQQARGDKEKRNLYEIKDYIDRSFNRDIKLSFFSERYYLSKEYLSKLFRDEFGHTIYEYVLKVRMEKARELLADPDVKVLTVSQRLGYQDTNYFSRAFKTYYGISPTEYRERKWLNDK